MRIIALGDIVGSPGRRVVASLLGEIKREFQPHLVIANGENAAGGIGLTPETAQFLFQAGIDVITSGNHIWAQKDIIPYLDGDLPIIRPLNYPPGVAGSGYIIRQGVMVVNLIGRTFVGEFDCPFRSMDNLLAKIGDQPRMVVVDFHAEATSEKMALGYYLDGRVSAVLGTHTHVMTADAQILPRGTAYITDLGMSGPIESVIGDDPKAVIQRFLTAVPQRLPVAKGRSMLNGVFVELDEVTGLAQAIKPIHREEP